MIIHVNANSNFLHGEYASIWQQCTLNITSFRSKDRPAKLWELSFQGIEISRQNCQIEVQRPRLATNDNSPC